MLTAEECREISYKKEREAKQERDEWQESLWRDWFPEAEHILGVINYKIEEEIKFVCTSGRYSATIPIMNEITFHLGNSYVSNFLHGKTVSYIINTVYDRYTSAGFKVEIADDDRSIEIRWS